MTITLEGAVNFRDLGGWATGDGRRVKGGLLYRSGSLSGLSDADLETLERHGVRTVVDFRIPSQIETFGEDRIPTAASYVSLPMGAGELSKAVHDAMHTGRFAGLPDMATVNLAILVEDGDSLAAFLRIAAEPGRTPLIFHCIGGKDRTGVAAAVLLSLLGVPWQAVREDYERSNDQLAEAIDAEIEAWVRAAAERSGRRPEPIDFEAAKRFAGVDGTDLDAVRHRMVEDAGSIEAYVRDRLGIDDATVAGLRDMLLE